MTKAEKKKLLLAAAKRIVSGLDKFSCIAVCYSDGRNDGQDALVRDYADSVGIDEYTAAHMGGLTDEEARLARSLAILLFAETL